MPGVALRFPSIRVISLLFAVLVAETIAEEDHPDRMQWLGGYPFALPSPWYSGYLDYQIDGVDIHTHYIYVESETAGDNPSETPLIYWSNGGPGASSMFGLLSELGPLVLSDLSLQTREYEETGIPTPMYNPYSWTKVGSLLVFDAPAPVGFSYCNDDPVGKDCLSWTDELASLNTYTALQVFFKEKFPSFQSRPLYLTGESYAGVYIPTLARRILEGREEVPMNLKGFAVGDPCLGSKTDVCGVLGGDTWKDLYFALLFFAGHAQMPLSDFHDTVAICTGESQTRENEISPECQKQVDVITDKLGGFYTYSLYDDCTYRNGLLLRHNLGKFNPRKAGLNAALNDYPCGGGPVMESYVSMTAVKESLNLPFGSSFWEVDNAEGFDYTPTEPDLRPFYKDIASGKYGNDTRVLVYNGDTDPSITSFATQDWTSGLGLDEVQSWRPWTLDGCKRVGGYVTRYDGNIDFLTIRGAGHLVPMYKPDAALVFIKAWINGEDYPIYDKDCVSPPKIGGIGKTANLGTSTT